MKMKIVEEAREWMDPRKCAKSSVGTVGVLFFPP
jgi:hypothetical protein